MGEQGNLFEAPRAVFSPCGRYRYTLRRDFGTAGPLVLWIMLNPSTATDELDDPTITRCKYFSRGWGFGSMEVVNLFAFRSTDPAGLLSVDDPIGPENDRWILARAASAALVICAWGNGGAASRLVKDRAPVVLDAVRAGAGKLTHALTLTDTGQPAHPLYQRGNLKPREFFHVDDALLGPQAAVLGEEWNG